MQLPLIHDIDRDADAAIFQGNTKLGSRIWTWSMSPHYSCPGSTQLCRELCYGTEGFYRYFNNDVRLERNWEASKRDDFVDWIITTLRKQQVKIMRVHGVGDFYSLSYTAKWYLVMESCPEITFFFFTRSHTLPGYGDYFAGMSELPNVFLWYSVDREIPYPQKIPPRVRLAYMLTEGETESPYPVDLYFRDDEHAAGEVIKKINGVQVCPYEQNVRRQVKLTCSTCQICFSPGKFQPCDRGEK